MNVVQLWKIEFFFISSFFLSILSTFSSFLSTTTLIAKKPEDEDHRRRRKTNWLWLFGSVVSWLWNFIDNWLWHCPTDLTTIQRLQDNFQMELIFRWKPSKLNYKNFRTYVRLFGSFVKYKSDVLVTSMSNNWKLNCFKVKVEREAKCCSNLSEQQQIRET